MRKDAMMLGKKYGLILLCVFQLSLNVYVAPDLPLSAFGSYAVGVRIVRMQDLQRDKVVINTTIWYPALVGEDGKATSTPDMSGAPYPLVIYSHGAQSNPSEAMDNGVAPALVSHGFVVTSMLHHTEASPTSFIDRPLDIVLVLNKLATLEKGDLVGLIDTDHVGVTGHSFGGYTSIVAGGARINPVTIKQILSSPLDPKDPTDWRQWFPDWNWNDFSQYGKRFMKVDDDNLWPAITDERIRAVMPIAEVDPELFGEAGLAAVTKPVFIMAATKDPYNPYQTRIVNPYQQLGTTDHYLLTFVGEDHEFAFSPHIMPVVDHFAVAYFGYYLQGKQEYAQYLTEDYTKSLSGYDNLVWGIYDGK